jgi:hypothetical protein
MQTAPQRAQTSEPSEHLVQFYDADHSAWAKSVGRFLAQGLSQGDIALVIATGSTFCFIAPAALKS